MEHMPTIYVPTSDEIYKALDCLANTRKYALMGQQAAQEAVTRLLFKGHFAT